MCYCIVLIPVCSTYQMGGTLKINTSKLGGLIVVFESSSFSFSRTISRAESCQLLIHVHQVFKVHKNGW